MGEPLRLFEGLGLELELMIVDAATLDVRPIADQVLFAASGNRSGDHENGRISWSNELVLHLVELKTTAPERELAGVGTSFQENVRELDERLAPLGARLMPTGMHPWMDPRRETVLWPHDYSEVYQAYDRLFDCRRHGWANLQSVHLNLSFGDDQEFGRLHAAARLVLPLVPALAASSPMVEGQLTGIADTRLEVYRTNSARVPAMTGRVIPEPCYDRASYQRVILDPLQTVVGDLDEDGVLEGEWLNARGAIARFDRSALEIRLIDTQECPRADVAVAWAVACVVGDLCRERWSSREEQGAFAVEPLHALLVEATRVGPEARVADRAYARALGWTGAAAPSLGELWDELLESSVARHPQTDGERLRPLRTIRRQGTLSHRIRGALGASPSRARTHEVYRELCECLREGRSFAEE